MLVRSWLPRLASLLVLGPSAFAGIRYVDAALTSGANDGSSWANAHQGADGVQAALAAAHAGDQIWVARGTYKPTLTLVRSIYFMLKNGVGLYGGFAGFEVSLSQRDPATNVTILSGDLAGNDGSGIYTDNTFHVTYADSNDASAVLDGFTVRDGFSPSSSSHDRGAGLRSEYGPGPTIRNCTFRDNRSSDLGGAVYAKNAPSFLDCRFESNSSGGWGGAVFLAQDSAASFTGCVFAGNTAVSFGGAVHAYDPGSVAFARCVFAGNSAGGGGGLGLELGSGIRLSNCILWDNSASGAGGGGAIWVSGAYPAIVNCTVVSNHAPVQGTGGILSTLGISPFNSIIYFNDGLGGAQSLVSNISGVIPFYSCVQGGAPGAHNIDVDPQFVYLPGGDVHLQPTSPCADAGSNPAVPTGLTTDFGGNARFSDDPEVADTGLGTVPVVDIGAHEVQNTLYSFFCAGDGTLASPCPCGNTGAVGRGCRNSDIFTSGAGLVASGRAVPDTVVLSASDMLASVTCVFLQGDQQNASGVVFGDGVRCVAGSLKRLFIKSASGGAASAPGVGDPSISARSAALGDTIASGSVRYYQVYYRDPVLSFCPAPQGNSWNVSSGVILNW